MFLILGVIFIWGFNFVVIKIGLVGMPPLFFAALRFLFAALPAIFFVRRPSIGIGILAAWSLTQFALQFALLFGGMSLGMPAGLASLVIIQLQTVFTILLAMLILSERPRWLQIAGALVATSGMVLVALNIDSSSTLIGFALVVAAALAWACANILAKHMPAHDGLGLAVWGSLIATAPLIVLSLVFEGPDRVGAAIQSMGWRAWLAVMFQAYPNTLFGFAVWSTLTRRYTSASVAPWALLVPVVAIVSSVLVLGESLDTWKIWAAMLVLGGLALNQYSARRMPSTGSAPDAK